MNYTVIVRKNWSCSPIVLPDLSRQNSAIIFKNYILDEIFDFLLCLTKLQYYYGCINAFLLVFTGNAYSKVDAHKIWMPFFKY